MKFEFKIIRTFSEYKMVYQKKLWGFCDSPYLVKNYDYKATTNYSERFIKLMWP